MIDGGLTFLYIYFIHSGQEGLTYQTDPALYKSDNLKMKNHILIWTYYMNFCICSSLK